MNEALRSFLHVSREYPANALAQSAGLALEFQKRPALRKQFEELPYDYHTWDAVRKAARFPHGESKRRQGEASRAPDELTDEKIVSVLVGEATLVSILLGHPRQALEEIAEWGKSSTDMKEYITRVEQRLGISLPFMRFE